MINVMSTTGLSQPSGPSEITAHRSSSAHDVAYGMADMAGPYRGLTAFEGIYCRLQRRVGVSRDLGARRADQVTHAP